MTVTTNLRTSTATDFLADLAGLPDMSGHSFKERLAQSSYLFDQMVDFLRSPNHFPNIEVNQLINLLWRLIGNKKIPLTMMPMAKIQTLSFVILGSKSDPVNTATPYFLMPLNWLEMIKESPSMQLGAIVFIASQAQDYHTGRLPASASKPQAYQASRSRAAAFEAEMLLALQSQLAFGAAAATGETTLGQTNPLPLELNQQQRCILADYPGGLKSLPAALYYKTPAYFEDGRP